MTAQTLSQTEGGWTRPEGVFASAATLERIESYIDHRFWARDVVWMVEGPGLWLPPLAPLTSATVSVLRNNSWVELAQPDGFGLTPFWRFDCGIYRVQAVVGAGPIPASVGEAARLFENFTSRREFYAGMTRHRRHQAEINGDGGREVEVELRPDAMGKALQMSGAADLLRPWRRPR